jgi:hypothetical protein
VSVSPFAAKLVKQSALLNRDQRNNPGRQAIERDLSDERLGHRVLVGNIVLEQLGR